MAVLFAEMRWNTFTFDMSKLFAQIDNRVQMAGETTDPLGGGPITVNGVDHAYTTDSFSFAKIFALGPDRNTGFGGDGITINATDEVTAGQAEILGVTNNAGLNYNIAGFSVGLTNLYAAGLTTDLSDDRALQQLVFAGDDYVDLEFSPIPGANAGGNIFSSGAGRDYILSADGNDTLNGVMATTSSSRQTATTIWSAAWAMTCCSPRPEET